MAPAKILSGDFMTRGFFYVENFNYIVTMKKYTAHSQKTGYIQFNTDASALISCPEVIVLVTSKGIIVREMYVSDQRKPARIFLSKNNKRVSIMLPEHFDHIEFDVEEVAKNHLFLKPVENG